MSLLDVSLHDKYALESGHVYMTGTQALVRLALLQAQRDKLQGLNTAGFVSGYRGSPLGNVDKEMWAAGKYLKAAGIHFEPGVNEDLGATAVWGSQQVGLFPGAKVDGVYGMWYGKTPGVDRSGDVFKHANYAGTSKLGGVLVLAGDDHNCKSSTVPCQSEYAFMDAQIPVLNPANVQEFLDFGLIGWAMSRYSGCWVAMKTISETVDASTSVMVDPNRVQLVYPTDFVMPEDGVHIRWPDKPLDQEYRLQKYKLYAALAFARANKIDKIIIDSPKPRLGIITSGKSYMDVLQALEDLGIDEERAADLGIRLYKVGMPWPLERKGATAFAKGLEEILVVEEKRAVIENQLKEQLYNWDENVRPRVYGKFNDKGEWCLPSANELTPAQIARVIAEHIQKYYTDEHIEERLNWLAKKEQDLAKPRESALRVPHFCSGCPHNTSTLLPEGTRATGGIGCHYMATWMNRGTATFTQMGGEGVPWVGQAPFTNEEHIFANLGDGTYYHSGILAIRQAIAAKVNITYKILFNDAVAMTGGQPVDGPLTIETISRQLEAEGVARIALVADDLDQINKNAGFAKNVTFHPRDDLMAVQKDLHKWKGVSAIIYVQTCAAELRRRRKRGKAIDPDQRTFINDAVCEGCGDCGVKSNCVSVMPLDTAMGRKRTIDQSNCNKDFSCVRGFCPSFVTVRGAKVKKAAGSAKSASPFPGRTLPEPQLPALGEHPYSIVITGIGGTGVVTIGALLGMAAHLESKGVSVLDMTGLAQKNGSVISHVRLAKEAEDIHAVKIPAGGADLLMACDLVTAASYDSLAKLKSGKSKAVVNTRQTMTPEFTVNPDAAFPATAMENAIAESVNNGDALFLNASSLAENLMGDSIASNLFMVGYAYQMGLIPLSSEAILRAIELNAVAIDFNKQAFNLGRWAAHDIEAISALAAPAIPDEVIPQTVDEIIAHRSAHLAAYQNNAYADRYRTLVNKVRTREAALNIGQDKLTREVALSLAKLMAYKDEYEVARLFSDPEFERKLNEQFEGDFTISFNMAPPFFAERDENSGQLQKKEYGPWMLKVMKVLAKFKGLRGTGLDIFGRTEERKLERALIGEFETLVSEILSGLTAENYAIACKVAALGQKIRGFGHVKEANIAKVRTEQAELMASFKAPSPSPMKQAAE